MHPYGDPEAAGLVMVSSREARGRRADEGSALILVLVLMVIGSLIVLPLMDFAMSVGRANRVLTNKTARTEAVKAGLRIAMAEPTRLYETCADGGTDPVDLPVTGLAISVATRCYWIADGFALDETQKRQGLAAVQVLETVPPILLAKAPPDPPDAAYAPPPGPENAWYADKTPLSVTGKLWLPNLPSHGLALRAPIGWQMPTPDFTQCTVFFPGTYPSAINVTGPTFFTSGIYYFENTVTVTNGADAVVGAGLAEGCTTDQLAAFYAIDGPSTHNINGLGATFVFGKAGRLVVDNNAGPGAIRLRFNRRYVADGDLGAAPSAGVSILSVNGALEPDGITGKELLVPGTLQVPLSRVGLEPVLPAVVPASEPATLKNYLPSTLVPATATVPDPPIIVTTQANKGAVRVTWTRPANAGHSQITGYTVKVSSGAPITATCPTQSLLSCVVGGLTNDTAYQFTVEATNAIGTSAASTPSASVTPTATSPDATAQGTDSAPGPLPPEPATPIIDINLTNVTPSASVEVFVPGHVSVPQGRFRVKNPMNRDVRIEGGVLAASFDVEDLRPAPIPIGLVNAVSQRTFQIVTETAGGSPHVVSSAILQVNESGAWMINSWEVQAD